MTVGELIALLDAYPEAAPRFVLPRGEMVPAHFHVTEVGRVDKSFIDCGGTQRQSSACLLQLWTASDFDHQLAAGKLAKILRLAEPVLKSRELPVEVEYGVEVAAQFVVAECVASRERLLFILAAKQTDCLAKDRCGVAECGTTSCCP